MRAIRRALAGIVALSIGALALLLAWALLRGKPQDLPWTPLDLGEVPGLFTGRKLARLADRGGQCRRLLDRAGVRYRRLPSLHVGRCGYDDAISFLPGGAQRIVWNPRGVGVACPVAAALAMWEWNVVQPAARAQFGSSVVAIDHVGAYNCRQIRGSRAGGWSEHATANAIDVAGFTLADGNRITVARDWRGNGSKATFLHTVLGGACGLFSTVLSPDYNAAHADHLHLDQAARGAEGWRACR